MHKRMHTLDTHAMHTHIHTLDTQTCTLFIGNRIQVRKNVRVVTRIKRETDDVYIIVTDSG